jgi:uncharacterized protein with ATP-grasp and redox domains
MLEDGLTIGKGKIGYIYESNKKGKVIPVVRIQHFYPNKKMKVIDSGHSAQGTILKNCSSAFKNEFSKADLIISKGQANFETLSDIKDKTIFYLLRAKCSSVASAIGCKQMDYVLTGL